MTSDLPAGWGVDTSSGLPTDFDATVKESFFQYDDRYGRMRIHWKLDITDGADNLPGEWEMQLNCGKDWETVDGGQTAHHVSGDPNRQFHGSSQYGMVIANLIGAAEGYGEEATLESGDDLEVDFAGAADALVPKGLPTSADIWVGSQWHFDIVHKDYGEREVTKDDGTVEKQKMVSNFLAPTRFLGVDGETKAAADEKKETKATAKAAAAKARAKAKKAEAPASDGDGGGIDPAAVSTMIQSVGAGDAYTDEEITEAEGFIPGIIEALQSSDSHDAFMDAAFTVDGLDENQVALDLVADEDEGFWSLKG